MKQQLRWFIRYFPSERRDKYERCIEHWFGYLTTQIQCVGPVTAIAMAKAIRNHVTRYLSGAPLHKSVHPMVGLNKSGVPKALGICQDLLKGDHHDLRFLMTLLVVSREIPAWKPVDYSSIVQSPKVTVQVELIQSISRWAADLGCNIPTEFEEYHVTAKTGPNGLAMDTSLIDLSLLPDSGIAKFITTLGGEPLKDMMNQVFGVMEEVPLKPMGKVKELTTLRRLSIKKDKEGKSRVFAILDYWSQTALRRLHSEILSLLKQFKTDCTFDQGSRLGKVSPNPNYHSIDLTNATDRFPLQLQEAVLSVLIGPEKSRAWAQILVHIPYMTPQGSHVAYAAGQPMGAYSSWAVFALCHHLVIKEASVRAGFKSYSNYMLLGDDVVLGDDDVAKHYNDILTQLGVETSPHKTHISKHCYEFAKRWFYHDVEITGVPISALSDYQGPSTVLSLLQTIERNWHLPYQAYSRSDLAKLLRAIGLDESKIRLETTRIWESRLLPTGKLEKEENFERNWKTYEVLTSGYLGCHVTYEQVLLALNQFIPMAKIKAATVAVKDTVRDVVQYRNKLIRQVASDPTFNKELLPDLPTILSILPMLAAPLAYARTAQTTLDRMENLIAEGREEEILVDPPVIGFNPLKLDSKNRDSARYYIHTKIPKVLRETIKEYLTARSVALSGGTPAHWKNLTWLASSSSDDSE